LVKITVHVKKKQLGDLKLLIGPSGEGKFTLLQCINLLLIPDRGKTFLNGREIPLTIDLIVQIRHHGH